MKEPNQKELNNKLEGKTIKQINVVGGDFDRKTLSSIDFEDGTTLVLDSSYEIDNRNIFVEVI